MITIVAAIGAKFELAVDDKMLWNLPDDYNHFKAITKDHPVIMGRKSVDTMTDILEDRTAIIITRNKDHKKEGVIIENSIEKAISKARKINENVFIIGGGQIYNLGIKYADQIELTRVHGTFPKANVFFPQFSIQYWKLISSKEHPINENHAYSFTYETWKRIQ
ncbi:MAG TPA: dihydrofolate reductase [Edaphocola sp.]|nr:dihydrofolate reductase [Edaphocola sp.]